MIAFAILVGLLAIAYVLHRWLRLIAMRLWGLVMVAETDAIKRHRGDWPEHIEYKGP